MDACSKRRGFVHARTGKASAKDGRSLQMEEGLSMQHQLEEEESQLRSGREHPLAKHKALQPITRKFVAREANEGNS